LVCGSAKQSFLYKDLNKGVPFNLRVYPHHLIDIAIGNEATTDCTVYFCAMADIYPEDTAIQVSSISGHTSQAVLYVVTVIFTIAACLAILARLCARTFVAKQAGADDALIFIAGILSIAFCITTYKQTEYGMVSEVVADTHGATRSWV